MWPSLILLATVSAAVAAAGWRLRARVDEIAVRVRRHAIRQAELGRYTEAAARLALIQQVAEGSVDAGTSTVRAVHREIANIPFSVLESIPVTRDAARIVRAVHDVTADTVYRAIATVNSAVGSGLRKGLKTQPPPADDKSGEKEDK